MPVNPLYTSTTLLEAVASAEDHYRRANPKSEAQFRIAEVSLPAGNTRTSLFYLPFPLSMKRGEGTYVWDLDDHKYTNFLSEFTSGIFGHSHPKIIDELRNAMECGLNLSSHTEGEAKLAAAICERFPCFDKLRLTNSGTEANIMALVTARAFTGRKNIVVFTGGYHGGPLTFVGGASPSNVPFEFIYGQYNDFEATLQAIAPQADDIAAVLIEPVLGAGGCIPGDVDFLQGLQSWCHKNDALFIVDEVQTSRHHAQGLQPVLGLKADLTTMGKFIGGCMPIGVFGGRADIMELFDPRHATSLTHAGTFNNNTMTMRAGFVGLKEVYTPQEAKRLTAMGNEFREGLNIIAQEFDAPIHVTGVGSIMNIHSQRGPVTRPEQVAQENKELKDLLFFELLSHGFYCAKRGLISLNICHSQADLDQFADTSRSILSKHMHIWQKFENSAA